MKLEFKIILILIILTVVCSYYPAIKYKQAVSTGDCTQMSRKEEKSLCFVKQALEQKDPDLCKKAEDLNMINECIKDIAISKNDVGICEKASSKSSCYEYFIYTNTENLGLCSQLSVDKYNDHKSTCYISFFQDVSATSTISSCEKITKPDERSLCFFGKSFDSRDEAVCNKVSSNIIEINIKVPLKEKVGNSYKKNGVLIPNKSYYVIPGANTFIYKDICFQNISRKTLDASLCSKISNSLISSECKSFIEESNKSIR